MRSASCMQDFLLHFCEYTPLNAELVLFFVRASLFCIYYSFFANLSEPFLLFLVDFFLNFMFFLRWPRNSVINSYFG